MGLFSGQSTFGTSVFGTGTTATSNINPMKDIEVTSSPDDSVSSLEFSPASLPATFLVAGTWDNNVSHASYSADLATSKTLYFYKTKRTIICIY